MIDPQCCRCGFLAIRDEYNDAVCEATHEARGNGMHKSSMGNSTPARFFCFKGSVAFPLGIDRQPATMCTRACFKGFVRQVLRYIRPEKGRRSTRIWR